MSDARCYTVGQLLPALQMSRASFFRHRKAGHLPFLEEVRPRIGRSPRYRADRVDAYFAGTWKPEPFRPRLLASSRSGRNSA